MVFVGVGDDDAPDLVAVLHKIAEIRDDDVDAQHFVIREGHAAVDDHHVAAVFQHRHVLADLVQASQGDDAEFSALIDLRP